MPKQENSVTLTGFLGNDGALISSPKASICKLSLCQSKAKRNAQGGWDKLPSHWFKIVGFHDEARNMATMKKGSFIKVIGRLEPNVWEKDGVKHYDMQIIANQCEVLEYPKGKDRLGNPNLFGNSEANPDVTPAMKAYQEEELPF